MRVSASDMKLNTYLRQKPKQVTSPVSGVDLFGVCGFVWCGYRDLSKEYKGLVEKHQDYNTIK